MAKISQASGSNDTSRTKTLAWWYPERLLEWLFTLLIAVTPYVFFFKTEELFEFNKMVFVYGVTVAVIGVWATRMALERRLIWQRTALDIPLGLFFVSQLLSTVFSMHPYTSIFGYYSRFHGGLLSTISYILLYYAATSNLSFAQIRQLFRKGLWASIGVSVYAILEHFGHSFSCYLVTEGASFGADCWRQNVQDRVFATFGQPNWLAAYTIMLLSVGIYFSSIRKQLFLFRVASVVATLGLFLSLLFTKSRSGFLGFAVGLLVVAAGCGIMWWRHSSQLRTSFRPDWLSGVLGGLLVCLLIFGSIYTPSLSQLVSAPTEQPTTETPTEVVEQPAVANRLELGGSDSGEIRKIVWQGAWDVALRYPVFGSGVETFAYSYYLDRPMAHNLVSEWDFLYNKAHNEFLNFAATTGFVGLGAYVLLLGWFGWLCVRMIWQTKDADSSHQLFVISMAAAVVALSVSNFVGFSTVMVTVLLFLSFAVVERARRPLLEPANHTWIKKVENGQLISLFLISGLSVLLFILVVRYWNADVLFSSSKQLYAQGAQTQALEKLHAAVASMPGEAFYYDELATKYSELAMIYSLSGASTEAAQLATTAELASNQTLVRNPHHSNFYKSRASVFIRLAEVNPSYLDQALQSLRTAQTLAPTDPKLVYSEGVLLLRTSEADAGVQLLKQAIEMKPDYYRVYLDLAEYYETEQDTKQALEWYQKLLELLPNDENTKQKIEALTENS